METLGGESAVANNSGRSESEVNGTTDHGAVP
ncbi:hypothetical protein ABIB27_001008 [Arthrobacter sp. UYEF21]